MNITGEDERALANSVSIKLYRNASIKVAWVSGEPEIKFRKKRPPNSFCTSAYPSTHM
jgi:hypothetical protein